AAQVLFAYSTGLLFVGMYNFTQRAFYALGDYKTPIKIALILVAVDIFCSLMFIFVLKIGVAGLAYANTIAYLVGVILYLTALKGKVPLTGARALLKTLGKVVLSLVPGVLWLEGMNLIWGSEWWIGGFSLKALAILACYGGGFALCVLGGYALLKVEFLSIMRRKG
ncbi:MAG: lipid II flippase MurJ, partial [Spirochaetales bacterium]|nr:lipid II flippase MurJ [Spirochaetales bacterium]